MTRPLDHGSRQAKRRYVFASMLLAMFMIGTEITIVANAMPTIAGKLGDFSLYSWVFTAFLLTQASTSLLFGKLADLFGRKIILMTGTGLFLLGSVLAGFATSMAALVAFRLIQGLGAGAVQPVALTVVGDLYPFEERLAVQGYISSMWAVAGMIGPLVGGLIVAHLTWRYVFWINIPLALGVMVLLGVFFREEVKPQKRSLDIPQVLIFMTMVSALLLTLSLADQPGVSMVYALAFAALFTVTFVIFQWQERRATEPMILPAIWRDRTIASIMAVTFTIGMAMLGLTTYMPVYVQQVMGESKTLSGLVLAAMMLGWPLAASQSKPMFKRFGMKLTVRIGGICVAVGVVMLSFLTVKTGLIYLGVTAFITGLGFGFLNPACLILLQSSVPWSERGAATSSFTFARALGNMLGVAIMGFVLNLALHAKVGLDASLHMVFIGVMICGFAACAAGYSLKIPKLDNEPA